MKGRGVWVLGRWPIPIFQKQGEWYTVVERTLSSGWALPLFSHRTLWQLNFSEAHCPAALEGCCLTLESCREIACESILPTMNLVWLVGNHLFISHHP